MTEAARRPAQTEGVRCFYRESGRLMFGATAPDVATLVRSQAYRKVANGAALSKAELEAIGQGGPLHPLKTLPGRDELIGLLETDRPDLLSLLDQAALVIAEALRLPEVFGWQLLRGYGARAQAAATAELLDSPPEEGPTASEAPGYPLDVTIFAAPLEDHGPDGWSDVPPGDLAMHSEEVAAHGA